MGNKSKSANAAAKAERQIDQLLVLTEIIARAWGTRKECVEAAALFVAVANRLNIPAEPRAVSILAIDTQTSATALTGVTAAQEFMTPEAFAQRPIHTSASEFEKAGHMVITSDRLAMIFDPTFRQFSPLGFPDRTAIFAVPTTHPDSGQITMALAQSDVQVTYFFDDENRGWQEGFEHARTQWSRDADVIARHIRTGGTAEADFGIDWGENERYRSGETI